MLARKFTVDTEFPLPGSTGFLRGGCEEVRIIGLNADGTLQVGVIDRFASPHAASGHKTVARADLFERLDQAVHGTETPPLHGAARAPRQSRRTPATPRQRKGRRG